jgi:hypothetical protein
MMASVGGGLVVEAKHREEKKRRKKNTSWSKQKQKGKKRSANSSSPDIEETKIKAALNLWGATRFPRHFCAGVDRLRFCGAQGHFRDGQLHNYY